jgi:diaminohydroxyphosphoribosylaminopyrimidine deaminase/5-amino-6-(5-phosphoribosylamino)uracil reductase
MSLAANHDRLLERALDLARSAVGFASPNPTVGCVLARNKIVLGEGAHLYAARDHAEIAALKHAARQPATRQRDTSHDHDLRGSTAYVTLEPCAHHGRTGPCSDALLAAGISRCIVATIDPNPLVRGQGLAKLRSAGVDVVLLDPASPLAQQARRLNDAFAFSIQHSRPFVTLKAAVSLDGYLAPPDSRRTSQSPHWLTGPAARADVQQLRHASDAILTGIGTVLADNPSLTDRTGLPRRLPLLRVVLDSNLRLPLASKLLNPVAADLLIVTSPTASEKAEHLLRARGADILRIPLAAPGSLDLHAILRDLHSRHVQSVLLEAGSALNGSFLAADLVDRVVLYSSEVELGEGSIPFAAGQPPSRLLQTRLTSIARTAFPHDHDSTLEDTRIIGYLHDPWSGIT